MTVSSQRGEGVSALAPDQAHVPTRADVVVPFPASEIVRRQVVRVDDERTRDLVRYSDHEINRLPWWKRIIRRLERVFVMNR